jgi:hypothetical protein
VPSLVRVFLQQAEAAQAMRSSGITLIAEELAAQRRRARVRAFGWIVAAAMSLGAIYVSGDAIHLYLENDAKVHQLVRR